MDRGLTEPEAPIVETTRSRVLLATIFLLTLAAFWPTLLTFHPVWMRYGYSHGYIIGLLTIWLVWRDRNVLMTFSEGWPFALLPLVGLSGLWLAATILTVGMVQQVTLAILLVCWGVATFGLGAARVLLPIGATFLLAVPVWDVLIRPLQLVTIMVSKFLLWVIRLPADVQGEFVTIPAGTIQIAESCAGLIYLLSGLVVGVLYAHVFAHGWRAKLAVLGLATAISLASNWIRVVGLVVIGHATDMRSSLMTSHGTYGWVIFTIALVPFFILARRLEKWGAEDPASPQPPESSALVSPEASVVDETDAGVPTRWWGSDADILARAGLASAVALVGPIIYFGFGALPDA